MVKSIVAIQGDFLSLEQSRWAPGSIPGERKKGFFLALSREERSEGVISVKVPFAFWTWVGVSDGGGKFSKYLKLQALSYQGGPWARGLWLCFLGSNADRYWAVSPALNGE